MPIRKTRFADLPDGADSPLNMAVKLRDRDVLGNVRRALEADEVLLAFQPVMQARAPGQVAFYEGLIRVLDATGRVIPAREFIGQAEESELGRMLDCKALKLGLKALKAHPKLRLSINMSARSIGYNRWRQILGRFLKQDVTLGERLILEISETSAMTVPEIVTGFMAELQSNGICFALDDFGSGMTSIRYLKDFYFDMVKVDGQFINGIHADPDKQVVTAALISVARQFDMFVIAENVETRADADFLISSGADCLQGYLYGAPTVRPPWLPQPKPGLFG